MAEVRHERRYLHPRLSHVLSGLVESPLQQALGDRVAEVGASAGPSPTGEALRGALAAHLWLLERAASHDGLPLTAAGWSASTVAATPNTSSMTVGVTTSAGLPSAMTRPSRIATRWSA